MWLVSELPGLSTSRGYAEGEQIQYLFEQVGTFDPRADKGSINLKLDRVEHWLKVGAKPSDTVKGIIKRFQKLQPQIPSAVAA